MTNRRFLVARCLVALTTLAVLVVPLSMGAAGAPSQTPGSGAERFDPSKYWETIRGPRWRAGGDAITQYTWDPFNTDVLYVTNGTEIQVSGNRGGSWRRAYVLPALTDVAGFTADDSQIVDLQTEESSGRTDVYALVEQTVGGTQRPHVIASHDGGRVWAPSDIGLPPTGRPIALRVSPNDPNELYLALGVNADTIDLLYYSNDYGATWTIRSDVSKSRAQDVITGLEIDPQNSDNLWATANSGLFKSTNGGASFEKVDYFGQATGPIDVFNTAGVPRISVFVPGLQNWYRSNKTGGWGELDMRGVGNAVGSVAHGPTKDSVVIIAGGNAYAWDVRVLSWVYLEQPNPGMQGIVTSRGIAIELSGHTADAIQIYTGPVERFYRRLPDYLIDVAQISNGGVPQQFPPRLGPKRRRIVLEPGETKTVPYSLKLPPRPLPLDVYFLLDTSASTTTFLRNVAQSVALIADGLADSGIAVRFGLADYRAYPNRTPPKRACEPDERASMNDCEANYAYRQLLDLGYNQGDDLGTALETLIPDGGGAYRSMYAALYQSVTGAGQDLGAPIGSDFDHDIPKGEQAHFNGDALKVILHAVDESFPENEDAPDPAPGDVGSLNRPDMTGKAEAIAALNQYQVHQVGLSTGAESLEDLRDMARATNTLAPAGGVDCNGNGTIDIPGGEPLVCSVNPNVSAAASGLVPAIERTLEALPARTQIALEVSGSPRVIKKVDPRIHPDVLEQTVGSLEFAVTFTCPKLSAVQSYDVDLKVPLEDRKDATAAATVVCRVDPDDPPEEELPPLPPVPPAAAALVALALPPPPPPPPPVLEISSASQSQSQAQAQAGMVHQEQEQPQLASVTASRDIEQELAFSRYREESDSLVTPIRALGAGAVVMSFAFGFLMLSQELAREKVLNRRR